MAEQAKVPSIRFAGFTDPWEQRKLGELMDVASVRRVHQEDWTDEGVRFLRARDLVAFAKNESIEDPLFISSEMYKEYSAQSGKVSVGDLLVTGVGTIGVPWLVTSDNPVYFKDGNIIWFKNRHSIDGGFFYHSFTASAIQNCINEAAGIGTVGTYTIETGKKTPIWLPSRQEQREIAAMMTHLDDLITLHQRKRQWLKWLDEGGEGTHHDIDILVFKFADDMKISVLCGVHACMTKSLGHTGNRYAGKQQQRGMGVP